MTGPDLIAVEATRKEYRVLTHPSGAGFDDHGKGLWPADQFTYRLIEEGSVRRQPAEAPPAAKAKE